MAGLTGDEVGSVGETLEDAAIEDRLSVSVPDELPAEVAGLNGVEVRSVGETLEDAAIED